MGVVNKFLNYLGLQDEQDKEREEREEAMGYEDEPEVETSAFEPRKPTGKNNIVSIHSQKHVRVILSEPRTYDNEAQEIADHLKSRRSVVVNLQRVRRDQAIRMVDFLSGTVYALGGHISKLGPNIFMCTPDSVEITGTISELLSEDVDYSKMR